MVLPTVVSVTYHYINSPKCGSFVSVSSSHRNVNGSGHGIAEKLLKKKITITYSLTVI
jgi:hypothetical protein